MTRALALALVLLASLPYLASLNAPFVFDDLTLIVEDPSIRRLWPIGGHPNRPVLTTTLALNYAISGLDPAAFRLTNVAIHALASLLLFGALRRTLRGPVLGARFATAADGLAFAVAGLWCAHPLLTQAVTYVWQRGESLMGLCFLATLYCVVRWSESGRGRLWGTAAFAAFLAGLGTKEVMVAVVPAVLIYDALLLSPSLRETLRRRWPFYAVSGGLLVILALVVLPRTATTRGEFGRLEYAASQPGVLLEYLRLAIWPHPLCFDYGRRAATGFMGIGLPLLALSALGLGTLVALWKRSWLGVVGAWYLLILMPSSSFVPINDLMVEYRLYLPLIAVVVLVVVGGRAACVRWSIPPIAPLAGGLLLLAGLTVLRNRDYTSAVRLWRQAAEVAPENGRAHENLSIALIDEGQVAAAEAPALRALELNPGSYSGLWNLGTVYMSLGRDQEALEQFKLALAAPGKGPHRGRVQLILGDLLMRLEQPAAAVRRFKRAAEIYPELLEAHDKLARAALAAEQFAVAESACRRALELSPQRVAGWTLLAQLCIAQQDRTGAVEAFEEALRLTPENALMQLNLGLLQVAQNNRSEALRHVREALERDPSLARKVTETTLRVVSSTSSQAEHSLSLELGELALKHAGRDTLRVTLNLARAYGVEGELDRALELYERLLAIPEPEMNPEVRQVLLQERASLRGGR